MAAALSDNSTQAQAIQKALTGMGVDPKDIQTSAFNVYPQQLQPNPRPDGSETTPVTTYAVDNTVSVTVRDLSKLGALLDQVVKSGANNINGIQFDAEDKTKALSEARKLAIQDAKNQAQEIATDFGRHAGRHPDGQRQYQRHARSHLRREGWFRRGRRLGAGLPQASW